MPFGVHLPLSEIARFPEFVSVPGFILACVAALATAICRPAWILGHPGLAFCCAALVLLALRLRARGGRCRTVADLTGKVAIVTGGNTGIGKESAIALAKVCDEGPSACFRIIVCCLQMHATVVLACRSKARGLEAVKDIIKGPRFALLCG